MIAYHVDRRGTLSPGQQIFGTPAENLFGLPILSQWGLDEVHLLDNLPRIFDRCVKAHIDWHNMEVRAERIRQIYYQDSVSRFSCFYAVPQLDHFAFWADMIQIKPSDRIFQVHYYFWRNHACIVPKNSSVYHIYPDCRYCDTSYFWIYNVEQAENLGYSLCSRCDSMTLWKD